MQFDLRRLDIYRKVPKDLTQPTLTGACISVACICFIFFLLLSEFLTFITIDLHSELFVHNPGDSERVPVILDISLPNMGCEFVGLDIQDDLGRHEVGHIEDTTKTPLNEGVGCRFVAKFLVNKVPGNFHVSTHSASSQPDNPDMSHYINSLVLGESLHRDYQVPFPKSFDPLSKHDVTNREKLGFEALSSHDYFMKIVPTIYEPRSGAELTSYQYTFAYRNYLAYGHGGRVMPAIWFRYDLTPITVKYTERMKPFYSFLTTICAVVGGTFTVASFLDAAVFTASEFYRKFELGKQG